MNQSGQNETDAGCADKDSVTSVTVISVLSEYTGWPSAVSHLLLLECEDIWKELQCSEKIKHVQFICLFVCLFDSLQLMVTEGHLTNQNTVI